MEEIHTSPEKPKKKRPVSADGQERPRKRPAVKESPRPRKRPTVRRYTKIKETRNESRRAGRIASTKTPDKYRRICKAEETCFAGRKEVRQEAPQKKETADGHVESGASACGHRGILFFGIFADPHWAEL